MCLCCLRCVVKVKCCEGVNSQIMLISTIMDPLIYFIIAVYVLDLRLYSILFSGFLISKINVALQLTKL